MYIYPKTAIRGASRSGAINGERKIKVVKTGKGMPNIRSDGYVSERVESSVLKACSHTALLKST